MTLDMPNLPPEPVGRGQRIVTVLRNWWRRPIGKLALVGIPVLVAIWVIILATGSGDLLMGIPFVVFGVIWVALYFVPTIVAHFARSRHLYPILAVNVLLGWTFLGWVVALVWALPALDGSRKALPPAGWYPDPSGAAFRRYWDGRQWTSAVH